MGTDIRGWIEIATEWVPQEYVWSATVAINLLVDRDYDAFGCLFGVMNYASFQPIAPARGIPSDASETVQQEMQACSAIPDAMLFPTWISWQEIQSIDLNEQAYGVDRRLHRYRHDEHGELVYEGKSLWSPQTSQLAQQLELSQDALQEYLSTLTEAQEWHIGEYIIRAEKMRRRDVLGQDWQALFQMMKLLAMRFGAEHVRLVVWFDR